MPRVARNAPLPTDERAWGARALLVLQSPSAVFAALRDDTDEVAQARQETVTGLVFLAGIAAVLAAPATGRLLDDFAIDGLLVALLAIAQGGIYGLFGYWIGSALLLAGLRAAGSLATYRRTRHVFAYALAPLALSLVALWPLRLALYGEDTFRTGGTDAGTGGEAFGTAELVLIAWAAALVALGVRVTEGWGWARAVAASAPVTALAALAIGARVLG